MAAFQYQAMDAAGKKKKGVLEADSAAAARQQLREKGLMPLNVELVTRGRVKKGKQQKRIGLRRSIGASDLALLTRQLATLIAAGIPLDEALTGVAEQTEKPRIKTILLGVRSKVMEGHSLARGMEDFPRAFSKLYRTTVASGEQSGKLDKILERLADYTEKQQKIKQKIKQALIYPALMTVVSLGIIVFLMVNVVPKIVDVFTQSGQVLPFATILLLAMSHFIVKYGIFVLIGLIAFFVGFRTFLKRNVDFRRKFHGVLLKIPLIGRLIRTINCARFSRTLGILTAAGVPILDALKTSVQLIAPLPMRESVDEAIVKIREGIPINKALKEGKFFPPMFIHLVASGEASGQLESMLEKAANNQDDIVETVIESSLTLFEPLMILLMGGIVLFIVMAIMLPIFGMDQLAR